MLTRVASGSLAPFVGRIWVSREEPGEPVATGQELVLPTGFMYLVVRLDSSAVIGGARASYYVGDASRAGICVGAELLPGTARLLFGAPADALRDAHTPLDCVWMARDVERMREQLAEAHDDDARLDRFEALLRARLPRIRALHPAVAEGLMQLGQHGDVSEAVRASGYSHRGFNNVFAAAVGLTPKLFVRVRRFTDALERVHGEDEASLAALALAAGYSDQAHFNRDFREFAGMSPGHYRARSPRYTHHVPLD